MNAFLLNSSLPPCKRQASSVEATKFFAISITLESDYTDLRPANLLFHVHPGGGPFITYKRSGLLKSSHRL